MIGDARECLRELAPIVDDWSGPTDWVRTRRSRDPGVPRLHRQDRGADRGRRADLRPGGRRDRPPRRAERLRAGGGGRAPGRAQQRLAGEGSRQLRLRVRVLVHGLRDLRCVGGEDGDARPRGDQLPRRRLLPDDELRPVLVGAHRAQADRDRVRQRRVRGDPPAAGQPGWRRVQQPARGHRITASSCASTSPLTRERWAARPRR